MRMPTLEVDGLRMHYVDDGEGDPILLLHGEPTWSYLWRNIIPQLPGRKIAPDLIGFGRSDKPEEIGWYSYDKHVESIVRLVESLDLNGITLVVDALRSWDRPALVVWGGDDRVLPLRVAEMFVGLIPGARGPIVIEGASHFLQEDKPDEVAGAIRDFLAG